MTNVEDVSIRHCTIEGNLLYGMDNDTFGGGIFVNRASDVEIKDTTIAHNAAQEGGGIAVSSCSGVEMARLVITQNRASHGGGVLLNDNQDPTVLSNSVVAINEASISGGGLRTTGGLMRIEYCHIAGNVVHDQWGGGVEMDGTSGGTELVGNWIVGNYAGSRGGGIYETTQGAVNSNMIVGNRAAYGGGICVNYECDIICNTIARNSADKGGAIYLEGDGTGTITNNLFVEDEGYEIYEGNALPDPDVEWNGFYRWVLSPALPDRHFLG